MLFPLLYALSGVNLGRAWDNRTRCDQMLAVVVHVPKTGGVMLNHELEHYKFLSTVHLGLDDANGMMTQSAWVRNFACNRQQPLALTAEWRYQVIEDLGIPRLTSDVRLIAFVRSPLILARSMIEHEMRTADAVNASGKKTDLPRTPTEALLLAKLNHEQFTRKELLGGGSRGYNLINPQAHRLLPHHGDNITVMQLPELMKRLYYFVGVSELHWHSACVLEYRMFSSIYNDYSSWVAPFSKRCSCEVCLFTHDSNTSNKVVYSSEQLQVLSKLNAFDDILYSIQSTN